MACESSEAKTSGSSSTDIELKSAYFLHPSDHPGLIFVTQPLNDNEENYFTWRNMNVLKFKNKAGFVNGTIEKPDIKLSEFQSWVQCNAVVLSWLTNALSKELQHGAAHADTAREVWVDLDERFTQGLAPRVYELKRTILFLKQEKVPISMYYGRLKALWNEMLSLKPIPICLYGCTCGAASTMQTMIEKEKVFDFLMGLDDAFSIVRSQILSIEPLPTLGNAYVLSAQEEKQQAIFISQFPHMDSTALIARGSEGTMSGNKNRGSNIKPAGKSSSFTPSFATAVEDHANDQQQQPSALTNDQQQ